MGFAHGPNQRHSVRKRPSKCGSYIAAFPIIDVLFIYWTIVRVVSACYEVHMCSKCSSYIATFMQQSHGIQEKKNV